GADVPLREVGDADRVAPGTVHDAQRRAYLLPAGPGQGGVCGGRAVDPAGLPGLSDHRLPTGSVPPRSQGPAVLPSGRGIVDDGGGASARGLTRTGVDVQRGSRRRQLLDRKSTRLNSSHEWISYAV